MSTALLLVDCQQDFLARPGLEPAAEAFVAAAAALLQGFRRRGAPVLHAHTLVRADGADRMPHWVRDGTWACVAGSAGARPPPALAPQPGEPVCTKRYYGAFADPALAPALAARGVRRLVVAGLYLHGCVRSTVLEAYERGLEVHVAADAVASPEPGHARESRRWLDGRAARFAPAATLLAELDAARPAVRATPSVAP